MATLARWARSFGLTRAICILLLLALVPLRIANPPPLEEIRLRTFGLYQTLRPREAGLRPVVIVDIDEASLKEIGQWPWPRRSSRTASPVSPNSAPSRSASTSFSRSRTECRQASPRKLPQPRRQHS